MAIMEIENATEIEETEEAKEMEIGELEKTIFHVPKLLRDLNPCFYTPTFVSIGIFHSGKSDLRNMVKHKIAAYNRMCCRFSSQGSSPVRVTEVDVKAITSSILNSMDRRWWYKKIRTYEGDVKDNIVEFCSQSHPLQIDIGIDTHVDPVADPKFGGCSSDSLTKASILLLVDACFIFEILFNYLGHLDHRWKYYFEEWEVHGDNEPMFDTQNPYWHGIVSDLLLLENQIPLSFLVFLGPRLPSPWHLVVEGENIIKMMWEFASLNEYGIFTWDLARLNQYKKFTWSSLDHYFPMQSSHLLDLFYKRTVGGNPKLYEKERPSSKKSQFVNFVPFVNLMSYCKGIICKYAFIPSFMQLSTPLRGFFPYAKPVDEEPDEEGCVSPPLQQMWSAVELSKAGVKFEAVSWKSGMEAMPLLYTRFDERKSTIYLPEVRVDPNAHLLLRNFIALEITSAKYQPRPVTNFALFMGELIKTEVDVCVLRKAGILRNSSWSDVDLVHNFNSLSTGLQFNEACKAVDETRRGLQQYMKSTWNAVMATYFSKPWSCLGSIGCVLMLVLTMTQVLCMFYNCNPHSKSLY